MARASAPLRAATLLQMALTLLVRIDAQYHSSLGGTWIHCGRIAFPTGRLSSGGDAGQLAQPLLPLFLPLPLLLHVTRLTLSLRPLATQHTLPHRR